MPAQNFGLDEKTFLQLVDDLREGNVVLFETIFLEHFEDCMTYVKRNYSASHDNAYDATMDTLIAFRQRLVDGKVHYGNLRFLFTRMASQHYMRQNKKQNNIVYEIDEQTPDLLNNNYSEEDTKRLNRAWQHLKAECQELLKQYFYQNITLSRIAEKTGRSAAAIRKQKERCQNRLIEQFKKYA